jgi:predicted nucleic acid-binding protein
MTSADRSLPLVLDASVLVKWFLEEMGSAAARELLRGSRPLWAPDHAQVEVSGAILRRYREGKMSESTVRAAHAAWSRILAECVVKLVPVDQLMPAAVDLAFRTKHPLADCLYLAASINLSAELQTADRLLFERGQAVHPIVSMLEGCQPS